jgi:hypothetical protein
MCEPGETLTTVWSPRPIMSFKMHVFRERNNQRLSKGCWRSCYLVKVIYSVPNECTSLVQHARRSTETPRLCNQLWCSWHHGITPYYLCEWIITLGDKWNWSNVILFEEILSYLAQPALIHQTFVSGLNYSCFPAYVSFPSLAPAGL